MTIRGPVDAPTLTNIIQNVAPVVVAHAPNTNDPTNTPATSPPVITISSLLRRRGRPVLFGSVDGPGRHTSLHCLDGDGPFGRPIDQQFDRPDLWNASGRRHLRCRRVCDGLRLEDRQPRLHPPNREPSRHHDHVIALRSRGVRLQSDAGFDGRDGSGELDDRLRLAASGSDAVWRADQRHPDHSWLYSFTVQATDSSNPVQVMSQPLTIAVAGNGDIVTNGSFEDPVDHARHVLHLSLPFPAGRPPRPLRA